MMKLDFQVKLGRKLASTIQSITSDFQIGFGSFVDKELMPYISLVPDDNCQQENCPGKCKAGSPHPVYVCVLRITVHFGIAYIDWLVEILVNQMYSNLKTVGAIVDLNLYSSCYFNNKNNFWCQGVNNVELNFHSTENVYYLFIVQYLLNAVFYWKHRPA